MDRDVRPLRLAAVGDLHLGLDRQGMLRDDFADIAAHADLLLLAGDLTQHGTAEEGRLLAEELAGMGVPSYAVLGNHDYHTGAEGAIVDALESAGVRVLEGEAAVCQVDGLRVGVAGVKGFGSGFAGACATEFGEPEMKAFVQVARESAARLANALAELEADVRVAVTHYAPVKDTLAGERPEIFPFLGSYLLGEAIDEGRCDLALHGHAHHGAEWGLTPGGVPVRNVARPVLRRPYKVYEFVPGSHGALREAD